jgi:mannose/fructose/N-acetylgalactosamine-specific phosphotransferase system component IID
VCCALVVNFSLPRRFSQGKGLIEIKKAINSSGRLFTEQLAFNYVPHQQMIITTFLKPVLNKYYIKLDGVGALLKIHQETFN